MSEVTLTKSNFGQEVLNADQPVLVDFWAPWCGPCRMLGPVIDEIARENEGTFKVGKVNIDEQPELASQYGVMSIPTLMAFKGGKPVETSVGARPKSQILSMMK